MKKSIFKVHLALAVSLFFVLGTGCSSDSNNNEQTASEESSASVMEEDAPQESAQVQQEPAEEDAQANNSNAPATQQIQQPEDKGPVLTAMSTSYEEWNEDGNNVLDKEEFYQGLYQVWDGDTNSQIDENEFTNGANNFFADYNFNEYGEFNDWDTDGNTNLSVEEFREGMKNTVDQDPVGQELLVIWDMDNDDKIERIELDNITVRLDQDSN
ncbi:EF-hand domain-containing protein [Catalinimonas niigatensis]|uniref:hypothetical protein n=1 Tax=Catalinimonas niigatensis TaxID=1397264 RepID=UPI002666F3B9|nr:hypothetical protein [Catalinimonas niigatensis]WPP52398.1 hypothetical protein PZB72_08385 [Catalinimonas niigatensis]